MRNFREAVKREMEREGWEVHYSEHSPSDLICKRGNAIKTVRAKRNGHGHIYKNELHDLKKIQDWTGVPVIVAKVNGANEIIFIRLEKFLNHRKREEKTCDFTFREPRDLGFVAHQNGEFIKGGRK